METLGSFQGFGNLEELLEYINETLMAMEKMIVDVKIDGVSYSGIFGRDTALDMPLLGIETVEIQTATFQDIVKIVVKDDPLKRLMVLENLNETLEAIKATNEDLINSQLSLAIDSVGTFLRLIFDIKNVMDLDFENINYQETSLQTSLNEISHIIEEMIETRDNKEWHVLTDLIEKRMLPLLYEWRDIFSLLTEEYGSA